MTWRSWAYNRLYLDADFAALVPGGSVFGGGSLEASPADRPFVIISMGLEQPEMRDGERVCASSQFMTIAAHDEPGDYLRIDSILKAARNALQGPAADVTNGIAAIWQGDSTDLADDQFQTIMRNSEFRLAGKVG